MKIPELKYLDKETVKYIIQSQNWLIWRKASNFGLHYLFAKLKGFKADRKNKVAVLGRPRKGEEVYLCQNKKGYWISFEYGFLGYLMTIEEIKYTYYWNEKTKTWARICSRLNKW